MDYKDSFKPFMEALEKNGAFLTIKNNDEINTMTIGWALMGKVWGESVLSVLVRYSRYSFDMINNANTFSVSIPKDDSLKKELAFCGTKSKRDTDKIKECNFTLKEAKTIDGAILGECKYHIECEVDYKQAMDPNLIKEGNGDYIKRFYGVGKGHNDCHVIFTGKILDVYETEE